jgi:hypothetical protein
LKSPVDDFQDVPEGLQLARVDGVLFFGFVNEFEQNQTQFTKFG